jgi:hypothetical protein
VMSCPRPTTSLQSADSLVRPSEGESRGEGSDNEIVDLTSTGPLIVSSIPQFHNLTLPQMSQMRPCGGFLLQLPEERHPLHLHYPSHLHAMRPTKPWTAPNDQGIVFSKDCSQFIPSVHSSTNLTITNTIHRCEACTRLDWNAAVDPSLMNEDARALKIIMDRACDDNLHLSTCMECMILLG